MQLQSFCLGPQYLGQCSASLARAPVSRGLCAQWEPRGPLRSVGKPRADPSDHDISHSEGIGYTLHTPQPHFPSTAKGPLTINLLRLPNLSLLTCCWYYSSWRRLTASSFSLSRTANPLISSVRNGSEWQVDFACSRRFLIFPYLALWSSKFHPEVFLAFSRGALQSNLSPQPRIGVELVSSHSSKMELPLTPAN